MVLNSKTFFSICIFLYFMSGCSTVLFNTEKKDFNAGEELFNKGDCDGAKLKLEEALRKDPGLWKGYYYMAECALKGADYQEALQLAKKALNLIGKNGNDRKLIEPLLLKSGQGALNREDYENAILFFKELVSLNPDASSSHLWLGKAFLDRGGNSDLKAAIIAFKNALNISKDIENDTKQIREIFFARAHKYSSQGETYAESRCYLAYTENFNSQDIDAYIALTYIFAKMGNPIATLYYAKKAYALDPKNSEVKDILSDLNSPVW